MSVRTFFTLSSYNYSSAVCFLKFFLFSDVNLFAGTVECLVLVVTRGTSV